MKTSKRGFTLPEVMIASAVSSIILFGSFTILNVSSSQLNLAHAKMTLQEGPREALFKMAQEIRQTSKYEFIPAEYVGGATITFRVPIPNPDASTLVEIPSYTPLWAAKITYARNDSGQLIRTSLDLNNGTTKQAVLANNITGLAFSRPSTTSGLIAITLDTEREIPEGNGHRTIAVRLTTQAEARNP